jgi:four helix bundle protein
MRKHNFKNLEVWKKSRAFVADIYQLSSPFHADETFGITSQLRRAAISISLNISEGSGRGSNREFVRFLDVSYASLLETENLLYLCLDPKMISEEQLHNYQTQLNDMQKMINGLQNSLIEKVQTDTIV